MDNHEEFISKLIAYGVGQRSLKDDLFQKDEPPPLITIYDIDDEALCHDVLISTCPVPNCQFTSENLLEFENHYNASHQYTCSQCKRNSPSPHLLDLHVQENHDSFFAVLSKKKPSYCCYIEECKEKFMTADERLDHCVNVHKLPKDFRFDKSQSKRHQKSTKKKKLRKSANMDIDNLSASESVKAASTNNSIENKKFQKNFSFTNSKQKTFNTFSGKKFTKERKEENNVNIDEIMTDLKESLPN